MAGVDDPKALNQQVEQLIEQGEYQEAVPIAERAVEVAKRDRGPSGMKKQTIAYHEAGHAVVAHRLGYRVDGVYELHEAPTPAPTVVHARVSATTPTLASPPLPTPTPAATSYPEAADVWKEREATAKQEYDKAWAMLPEATRSSLHDEEGRFQGTIKAFDPPTRMRALKKRIEHFKTLTPKSASATSESTVSGATV